MHVIDSGGLYGAERVLLDLAAESRRAGHRPIVAPVVAPQDPADPLGATARQEGLEVHAFEIRDGLRLREFDPIADYARSERVDVVHTHGYKANIMFSMMRRARRPSPVLATLHGWTAASGFGRMRLYESLERCLLGRLDAVVAVSASVKAKVPRAAGRSRVRVIANGIAPGTGLRKRTDEDIVRFIDGRPAMLAAGRLSPEKGFDVLIEALRTVADRVPGACLVIAGEGRERRRLESLVERSGLSRHVLLAGYRPDIRNLMHLFDIYAMSSHTEGLPVVLLEAMAERLAVVATSVGGVPAVLDDGGCGRLVAPADPAGLAAALIAVLGDEREREALRDAGRRRFEAKYSAAAMAKRYHEAYAALCGASAGVPA